MMTARATSPAVVRGSRPLIAGFFNSVVGHVMTDSAALFQAGSYPRMHKRTAFCEQSYLSHEK